MGILRKLVQPLRKYFGEVQHIRTEAQLENERWLIPKVIPFNRWLLMPVALLIQACLGTLYAWSGFNLPIETKLYGINGGIDRAIAVNVFYLAVPVFAVASTIAGPYMERNGPKKCALIGGALFYLGHLITALGIYVEKLPVIYVGYGIFYGAGIGVTYICPVSPLQKWFPEKRGLAAGVGICGFGAGAIIAPYAQKIMIGSDYAATGVENLGIELTFVILGSCYFAIITLSALVLRMPPPGYEIKGISIHTVKGAERKLSTDASTSTFDQSTYFSMKLSQAMFSVQYWMIYVMFLGSQLPGLLLLSKIQSMVQNQLGKSANEAAMINAILSCLNLLGTVVFPVISDLVKTRRPLFALSLAVQAVLLGCLPTVLNHQSYAGALFCYFTIVFCYGAGFGLIPALLADQFGAKNVGALHGLMLTAWALDGIYGGPTFSAVYSHQKSALPNQPHQWYDLNFRWLLAPVLLSFLVSLFIPCNLRDKHLPRAPGESFRFRILGFPLIRIIGGWPTFLFKKHEEMEWQKYLESLKQEHRITPSPVFDEVDTVLPRRAEISLVTLRRSSLIPGGISL